MGKRHVQALLGVVICAAALGLEAQDPGQGGTAAGLDSTRSSVSKWMATQELIFKEGRDWREGKEVLRARIEATEEEISAAQSKLRDARASLAEQQRAHAEFATAERQLTDSSALLAESVSGVEAEVLRLRKMLPAPIQEKTAPLYRRIPEDPATTKVSVAERFQNVVGVLNEIHKANGEISLVNEIRPLSDGKPSEVKTVYVGLGQAYFLSALGEAGVGRPTADGWQWQAANELAQGVAEVIEILENKGKPKFISLPVTIQ